jgi:hypothetical protein
MYPLQRRINDKIKVVGEGIIKELDPDLQHGIAFHTSYHVTRHVGKGDI